jgi:hypothetical protein
VIQIQPVANRHGQVVVPQRIAQVLSTDAG